MTHHSGIEHVPFPEWWVSLLFILAALGFPTFWYWLYLRFRLKREARR